MEKRKRFKVTHSMKIVIKILFALFPWQMLEGKCVPPYKEEKLCYKVRKIRKQKNNVYFIYAERNDSIFKIYSWFDGNVHPGDTRLKRGTKFKARLTHRLGADAGEWQDMSYLEFGVSYHGVAVMCEPEKDILDVYSCSEINGRYLMRDPSKRVERQPVLIEIK